MLLLVARAAALSLRIEAAVTADGLAGTLYADEPDLRLVDPLAALPVPDDDRGRLRAFPGRVSVGEVRWEPVAPGEWRFTARLPRRYGDVGGTRDGLRANGGWYPQPVDPSGRPRVADWEVRVTGGATLVLNGAVGEGEVRWAGRSDRAALAVVPGAAHADGDGWTWIEPGRAEPRARERLAETLDGLGVEGLVVVVGPDFERVARAAPGMVYLSERAFRLSGPLWRFHLTATREAALTAGVPVEEAWDRAFVGAARAAALPTPDVRRALGWASWIPVVDALLYDGTLPYYGDLFDEAWPTTATLDDGLDPRPPARAVARQVDAAAGPGAALALAERRVAGAPLPEAALAAGLDARWVASWSSPPLEGVDYRARVQGRTVRVTRIAPAEAPPEPVEILVDDEPVPAHWLGPGPAVETFTLAEPPRRVAVDPEGHLRDADRANDRWPSRWTTTLSGGLYDLSITDLSFSLVGVAAIRRQNDSHNVYVLGAEHDPQDLIGLSATWVHYVGPALDRQRRVHRFAVGGSTSLLDPAFRPTDDGTLAVGGGVAWAWDTREGDHAYRGHKLWAGVGAGAIPGSPDRWASAGGGGVVLVPLHPRHVLALQGKAGWASGDVGHRLLTLGGATDVRAYPVDAEVVNLRLLGSAEYRWSPLRHASLPLPLMWLDEVQLAPGVDVGQGWRDGEPLLATGATLGVHTVVDLVGARPVFTGVTVAVPAGPLEGGGPQVYLEFSQPF